MLDAVYSERATTLPHTVAWTSASTTGEAHRVIPDGCMDLLWVDARVVVAGPDTAAYVTDWHPHRRYVGLRFGHGLGPRVVGVPAGELRDQRVPLDQLWPSRQVRALAAQLHSAAAPSQVLESTAAAHLARTPERDAMSEFVADQLGRGCSVAQLAVELGLSQRQLHRRVVEAFGYGPKMLARILRLQRALAAGRSGISAADVAVSTGYADQAHLAREVRALTGTTFSDLVGAAR